LPELRKHPGALLGDALPAGVLKHADEQAVAALAAVYQAIRDHGLPVTGYQHWGVLAAPRFLGRCTLASALQKFLAEGAWGVSPHLIPHHSIHSISGLISQTLKIHGPNFGIAGDPNGTVEPLLLASALLERMALPGVWLVLTGLQTEVPPEPGGGLPPGACCLALALALIPPRSPSKGIRLHVSVGAETAGQGPANTSCFAAPGDDWYLERFWQLLQGLAVEQGTILDFPDANCRVELFRTEGPDAGSAKQPHPRSTVFAPTASSLL
jgi:hypothetical protein